MGEVAAPVALANIPEVASKAVVSKVVVIVAIAANVLEATGAVVAAVVAASAAVLVAAVAVAAAGAMQKLVFPTERMGNVLPSAHTERWAWSGAPTEKDYMT